MKRVTCGVLSLLLIAVFILTTTNINTIDVQASEKYFSHYDDEFNPTFPNGVFAYYTDESYFNSYEVDPFTIKPIVEDYKYVSKIDGKYYEYTPASTINLTAYDSKGYDSLDEAFKHAKSLSVKEYNKKHEIKETKETLMGSLYLLLNVGDKSFEHVSKAVSDYVLYVYKNDKLVDEIKYLDIYNYLEETNPITVIEDEDVDSNITGLAFKFISFDEKTQLANTEITWDSIEPAKFNYIKQVIVADEDGVTSTYINDISVKTEDPSEEQHFINYDNNKIKFMPFMLASGKYHCTAVDVYGKKYELGDFEVQLAKQEDEQEEPVFEKDIDKSIKIKVSDIPKSTKNNTIPVTISVDKENASISLNGNVMKDKATSKSVTYTIMYNGTYTYEVAYMGKTYEGDIKVNCFSEPDYKQLDWGGSPDSIDDEQTGNDGKLAQTGVDMSYLYLIIGILLTVGIFLIIKYVDKSGKRLFSLFLALLILFSNSVISDAATASQSGSSSSSGHNPGGSNTIYEVSDFGVTLFAIMCTNDFKASDNIFKHVTSDSVTGGKDKIYYAYSRNSKSVVAELINYCDKKHMGTYEHISVRNGLKLPDGTKLKQDDFIVHDTDFEKRHGGVFKLPSGSIGKVKTVTYTNLQKKIDNIFDTNDDSTEFRGITFEELVKWCKKHASNNGDTVASNMKSAKNNGGEVWVVALPYITVHKGEERKHTNGKDKVFYGYSFCANSHTADATSFCSATGESIGNALVRSRKFIASTMFNSYNTKSYSSGKIKFNGFNVDGLEFDLTPDGKEYDDHSGAVYKTKTKSKYYKNTSSTVKDPSGKVKKFYTTVVPDYNTLGTYIYGIQGQAEEVPAIQPVVSNLVTYKGSIGDSTEAQKQGDKWEYDGGVGNGYYALKQESTGKLTVYSKEINLKKSSSKIKIATSDEELGDEVETVDLKDKIYTVNEDGKLSVEKEDVNAKVVTNPKVGNGITESKKHYSVAFSSYGLLEVSKNCTLKDLLYVQSKSLSGDESLESKINNGTLKLSFDKITTLKDFVDTENYPDIKSSGNKVLGYTYTVNNMEYGDMSTDSAKILGKAYRSRLQKYKSLADATYKSNVDYNKTLSSIGSGKTIDYVKDLLVRAYNEKSEPNDHKNTNKQDGDYALDADGYDNNNSKAMTANADNMLQVAVANTIQVKADTVRSAQTTFKVDISECKSNSTTITPKHVKTYDDEQDYSSLNDVATFDTPQAKIYYYFVEKRSKNTLVNGTDVNNADISDFKLYQELSKARSVSDFVNYVTSKGKVFDKSMENLVLGISSHNDNPINENDANYGYNIYYIQIGGNINAKAEFELYDYQLNHVFRSILDETGATLAPAMATLIGKGTSLPNKTTFITNTGISSTVYGALHGAMHSSWCSSHSNTESIIYLDNGSSSSGNGKTITKDNEFMNSSGKLPLILRQGSGIAKYEQWFSRKSLINGGVTKQLQPALREIDYCLNLSRGTSPDKRTLSGISYSSNNDSSEQTDYKNKIGTKNDNPYWAYNQLEMDGIDVVPKTVKDATDYYDSTANISGTYKETFKYDGITKSRRDHNVSRIIYNTHYHGGKYPYWDGHSHVSYGTFYGYVFNGLEATTVNLPITEIYDKYSVKVLNNKSLKNKGDNVAQNKYQDSTVDYGETIKSQYLKNDVVMTKKANEGSQKDALYVNDHGYALPYLQRYKANESNIDSNHTKDIFLKYYPEVTMSVQYYSSDILTSSSNSVNFTTVETLGEKQRKTRSSGLYLTKLKGGAAGDKNYKIKGSLFSDTSSLNVDDKDNLTGGNSSNITVYNGSDITLNADTSNLGLEFYGYGLDIIQAGEHTKTIANYTNIVHNGADVYSKWGNTGNKDKIKDDFTNYVKEFAKVNNFAADIFLEIGDSGASGSSGLYYNNYSTSIGKLQAVGSSNIKEDGVYNLIFDHGKLLKTSSDDTSNKNRYKDYQEMIKQLAMDYFGISSVTVGNADYQAAEKLFKDSDLYLAVLESIESDTEGVDGSDKNKNSSRAVSHDTSNGKRETFDTAMEGSNWYDEEVVTVVVRRFKTQDRLNFKNIILSDKVDYNTQTASGTGKWYMTLYIDNNANDISNKIRCANDLSYYNPSDRRTKYTDGLTGGEDGGYASAMKTGTILMDHIYIHGCDFQISGQSTDLMGN